MEPELAHLAPLRLDAFGAPHAFTTRAGGVSEGPFASLNLGLSTGDDPQRVAENRERVLRAFGARARHVSAARQVHGARVASEGPGWFEEEADAMTSADPRVTLVIGAADCLPLLLHDPKRGAVGAAHCGWRGMSAGVVEAVVRAMAARHGSHPVDLRVALGPAIHGCCYQVGAEVVEAFAASGFPEGAARRDAEGRFRLDLPGAARWALARAGVPEANVAIADACTHCDRDRFFSHRRDGERTGRQWALVRAPAAGRGAASMA